MSHQAKIISAVFRDRAQAEEAFAYLRAIGYDDNDINVLMSDKPGSEASAMAEAPATRHPPHSGVLEAMGVGGTVGTVLGAAAAGIAAIGTTLALPGLGLLVAGPLAAAFAGAGAGAVTGGLLGALVGAGITEPNARAYEAALRDGGVVMGVRPHDGEDARRIEQKFMDMRAESVVYD
jgi:hypothetical protein